MIYYPLSTLMHAGIREILFITTPNDQPLFKHLLGDGSKLGCRFEYQIQHEPNGLAQAFVIGKQFIGNDNVALILGDNIFFGGGMGEKLESSNDPDGGLIFAYRVHDPERYGVVEFDNQGKAISIEEKPENPKSNYAVPGLYFYDNEVIKIAENLKPSSRGEYEITDVNQVYLKSGKLQVKTLPRGIAWLDTGTFTSLIQASNFVQTIEERQGFGVGCIEAVAYSNGFINDAKLKELAIPLLKSGYGNYLMGLID
jgi:glucose-1-phosphate thymidylyltransferase